MSIVSVEPGDQKDTWLVRRMGWGSGLGLARLEGSRLTVEWDWVSPGGTWQQTRLELSRDGRRLVGTSGFRGVSPDNRGRVWFEKHVTVYQLEAQAYAAFWRGDYAQAQTLLLESAGGARRYEASVDWSAGDVAAQLAVLEARLGDKGAAERSARRALDIRERHFDANSVTRARSLYLLAVIALSQGRVLDGRVFAERALAIQEAASPGSIEYTLTRELMAAIAAKEGDSDDSSATSGLDRVFDEWELSGRSPIEDLGAPLVMLDALEALPGRTDQRVARATNAVAMLYARYGRADMAEELARKALRIQETVLGPEDPAVAFTLITFAEVHAQRGRHIEAEAAQRRALAIREKHGRDHPAVLDSLNSLAVFLTGRGRHAEAEALLLRALATFGDASDGTVRSHPLHGRVLLNLVRVYRAQGKEAQAAEAEARASIFWTTR